MRQPLPDKIFLLFSLSTGQGALQRKLDVPKMVDEREAFVGYSAARILPLSVIFAAVEAGIIDAKIGDTPIIVVVT